MWSDDRTGTHGDDQKNECEYHSNRDVCHLQVCKVNSMINIILFTSPRTCSDSITIDFQLSDVSEFSVAQRGLCCHRGSTLGATRHSGSPLIRVAAQTCPTYKEHCSQGVDFDHALVAAFWRPTQWLFHCTSLRE